MPLCAYGSPGSELSPFFFSESESEDEPEQDAETRALLNKSISELDLSVRSSNCLEAERIFTVGDLIKKSESELMQVRNFGKTSLLEIKSKLQELGLSLADQPSNA